jgi:anthranilate/para-aminobenzoate synthase component I
VARIGETVEVIGESPGAVRDLLRNLAAPARASEVSLELAEPAEPELQHLVRVRAALEQIVRGEIYEVNLARRFSLRVRGLAWDLLAQLEGAGRMPHAFALESDDLSVVAASPELCLSLDAEGGLLTSPIKGTRPRHEDPTEDARLARDLDQDPKERAELTMIVDVERNDLGRVAEVGSVRLSVPPHVVALPGIHHRVATVEAKLRPELSRAELLSAVLPSGSVTGAPKRRAMQLIRELEPYRRGLYTGVVGFVAHDGGVELKMAIRTLSAVEGRGQYFTGGGIVADSVPEREVEETLWKAERLLRLLAATSARN